MVGALIDLLRLAGCEAGSNSGLPPRLEGPTLQSHCRSNNGELECPVLYSVLYSSVQRASCTQTLKSLSFPPLGSTCPREQFGALLCKETIQDGGLPLTPQVNVVETIEELVAVFRTNVP